MFYPPSGTDACEDFSGHLDDKASVLYNKQWQGFVLIEDGGCSWEEKARWVERMGAQGMVIAQEEDAWIFGHE